jgi:hypothetical protein
LCLCQYFLSFSVNGVHPVAVGKAGGVSGKTANGLVAVGWNP